MYRTRVLQRCGHLIEHDAGVPEIVPSQSAEIRFVGDGGPPVSLCGSANTDGIVARVAVE